MFEAFDASGSALKAERVRMTAIANNLANAYTTVNEDGERVPFRRRLVVLSPGNEENSNPDLGVSVDRIVTDDAAPRLVWDPTHPDRIRLSDFYQVDEEGNVGSERRPEYTDMSDDDFQRETSKVDYVAYPNIDPVKEMSDAMLAARAYEANVAVVDVSKNLISETLSIIA